MLALLGKMYLAHVKFIAIKRKNLGLCSVSDPDISQFKNKFILVPATAQLQLGSSFMAFLTQISKRKERLDPVIYFLHADL